MKQKHSLQPLHFWHFKLFKLLVIYLLIMVSYSSLYAQTTLNTTAVPGWLNNNGNGTVTFNFQNTNPYPIIITGVEGVVGTAGLTSSDIWIKTTPISGPPGVLTNANGWTQVATGTFTGVANTTTTVTQPFLTGLSVTIPAGVTYGMAIAAYSGTAGRQRYFTIPAAMLPTTTVSGGGCNIIMGTLISYATGAPPTAPSITPRGWIGKLTFIPAAPCTDPPIAGTPTATASTVCTGQSTIISLAGGTGGLGQTYQWESATVSGGPYTTGPTTASITASPTTNTYYRCTITCGANSSTSSEILITVPTAFPGGLYTIDNTLSTGGGNFASFADAVSAIACGISGPVVFDVAVGTGPYTEQVTIPQIGGASAINTITFNGYNETLTFNATGSTYHTLGLNGADYIRVNNLNIVGTGATNALVGHLWNNADNNTFTNCTFTAPANGTSSTQVPFSCSGTEISATATGASGSNNELIGCTMNSGYYNTSFVGNSGVGLASTGNKVINCNLRDPYFYASYNLYQNGIIISGNNFDRATRTTLSTYYGVYLSTGVINALVENNKIRNTWGAAPASTGTQYSIYDLSAATAGNENKIFNNLISDINFNGILYGIYITSTNKKVYHNTISFDQASSTGTTTYGIYVTGATGVDVQNNNISITRGGTGVKYCLYYTVAGVISNYNNLYINTLSVGTNCVGFYVTGFANLLAWQAANANAWDQQSISSDPGYANTAIYNYAPTNVLLDNVGNNLGVVTDINSIPRTATPDIGCYEFAVSLLDVGALSFVSPGSTGCYSTTENIEISIKNYGAATIDFALNPVTVVCDVTGAATTTLTGSALGTLSPGATMSVTLTPSFNMTTNGTYTFNAYTILTGDGSASNDAFVSPTNRIVGPVGGTISSSLSTICVSGSPTLTLTGNFGGSIQWQESTVSASGPWTNVGSGTNSYSPGTITQTYYYQVEVGCNGNTSLSNTVTLNVNNPSILSTTPASRCGIGTVNLLATGSAGADIKWYSNSTGGSALYTGSPFTTPIIGTTTTFYAEAIFGGGGGTQSPIQVTEMDLGSNDQLEIQNVSPDAVDVTGWKVVVSNSYTDINSVNANVQILSGILAPGALIKYTDAAAGPNYWGSNILWNPGVFPTFTGWAAILDNNNILKDIVFMNWPSSNIAAANIIVSGTPILAGSQWSGNGIDITTVAATNSVSRQGLTDNNTFSDFAIIPLSLNATNPGMALPLNGFGCSSIRVPVVATINTAPSIIATIADPTLCPGGSTTVAVSSSNDPDYTYTWTSSIGGFTASGAGPHTVSPTNITIYTVNAIDNTTGPNAGCASQATISVITAPTLSAGTVTTSQSTYCVSGSPVLTVTGAQGGSLQWQSSTVSATGPWTNVGTGSITYSPGLVTQTTYYQVEVNCQTTNVQSNAVMVEVNNPSLISTTPGSRCGYGAVTLGATASGISVPKWYANATGGIALGSGNSFVSPSIATTTDFYVAANSGNGTTQISSNGVPTVTTSTQNGGLQFTLFQDVVLNSIQVYSTAAGTATVTLENSSGTVLYVSSAFPIIASNLSTPQTLALGWSIPTAVGYRIKVANTGNALGYASGAFPAPMGNGVGTITSGWLGAATSTLNYFVYNMNTTTGCEGTRVPVTATVNTAPSITSSPNFATICAGQSTTLSVTSPNDPDYTYTWNPGGLTGSSITVSPLVSTVYTVTALDNTAGPNAGCGNIATIAVTVNPLFVTLNPSISSSSVCPGTNVNLISNTIAPGYVMNVASTTTFVDISATGTDIVAPASLLDDSEHNISIPSFTFNGTAYTTARIGVNGLIALGSTAGEVSLTNATLPSTANTAGNVFLSPYWDDLDIQTGLTIKTQTIGNDFIIQFTNAAHNNFTTGGITFQVQLNLVSGSITYVYNDITFGDVLYDAGVNATVGIQFSASSALQYSFNTASLTTGQAISFTPNSATVAWAGPNGFVSALTNPTLSSVTSLESGTYTVTATGSNGCATSSTVNLTVKPIATSNTPITIPCASNYVWNGNTYTASGTYTYTTMGANGCDSVATLDLTVSPCNTTLNLTAFIEGYWDGTSAMLPVLFNQGQPNTATECDNITVELRDTLSPTVIAATTSAMLNTNGTASAVFSGVIAPGNYYVVVKHRNALQTWSAIPLPLSPVMSYNFTTAASQAYGSNQVEIATGVFGFYSGDFTSDENIDGVDLAVLETDATEFVFGYLYDISNTNYPGVITTDITGDGNADPLDFPALEANSLNFIFSSHP